MNSFLSYLVVTVGCLLSVNVAAQSVAKPSATLQLGTMVSSPYIHYQSAGMRVAYPLSPRWGMELAGTYLGEGHRSALLTAMEEGWAPYPNAIPRHEWRAEALATWTALDGELSEVPVQLCFLGGPGAVQVSSTDPYWLTTETSLAPTVSLGLALQVAMIDHVALRYDFETYRAFSDDERWMRTHLLGVAFSW